MTSKEAAIADVDWAAKIVTDMRIDTAYGMALIQALLHQLNFHRLARSTVRVESMSENENLQVYLQLPGQEEK